MATRYIVSHSHSPIVTPLYKLTQVVWYIFYILETILLLRFILKLIAANPGAAFTQFIYSLSAPLVGPFANIVQAPSISGAGVIDWPAIIALIAYWILAWIVVRLILLGRPVTRAEADYRLEEQDVVEDEII